MIIVGLDSVGKTTLLYKINLGEVQNYHKIWFNYNYIQNSKLSIVSWDLDGCESTRPLFRRLYKNVHSLVFVVDSTDRERIDEAYKELQKFLCEDLLSDAVLLVFANKKDLPNAMTVDEIIENLYLNDIRNRSWFIQSCCAINGEGLYEGFEWVSNTIRKKDEENFS
ncbi:hypothetical protein SteCoe_38418 [Stentor coeruleus]|uniref:ADP-ribosylation factor n=1 Tax=Stentor coeruleus TaxID=5963 RepID=A0A1R2ALF3_9CILI|nr:hypothetical protein SteCoe_38418 [Stentor coeruleus]